MIAEPTSRSIAQAHLLHEAKPGQVRALRGLDETQQTALIERLTVIWQSWCDTWGWQSEPIKIRTGERDKLASTLAQAWASKLSSSLSVASGNTEPNQPNRPTQPNQPAQLTQPNQLDQPAPPAKAVDEPAVSGQTTTPTVSWAFLVADATLDPTTALAQALIQPTQSAGADFSTQDLSAHDLAFHIAHQAINDLTHRWQNGCTPPPATTVDSNSLYHWQPIDPPASHAWSGAVYCELNAHTPQGHMLSWGSYLSSAAVAQLLGPLAFTPLAAASSTKPGQADVQPIDQALHNHSLQLRVGLNETQLEIGVLRAMRVGDVLRTSHALDQPWQVTVLDATADEPEPSPLLTLQAQPGRHGQQRAISLVAPI